MPENDPVVVPLGLDLGTYPDAAGSLTVPRIRLGRTTRDLDPAAYRAWRTARDGAGDGRLLTIDELARRLPDHDPAEVAALADRTPELMLVPQRRDDILVLWMITNLRLLMVNVGEPTANGALQLGLGDERFDLVTPDVFDVLLECARRETAAEAFAAIAHRSTEAGADSAFGDAFGVMTVLFAELPYLLAHGAAWLDIADSPYQPPESR